MKFLVLVVGILIFNSSKVTRAQSRCDTACSNNSDCSQGLCYLSKCSDTPTCFIYCLICGGDEKCYATGTTCRYSSQALLQVNNASKNMFKFNILIQSILLFLLLNFN